MMVDYVREVTVKKSCSCGKYRLFEHLLILFTTWHQRGCMKSPDVPAYFKVWHRSKFAFSVSVCQAINFSKLVFPKVHFKCC